MARGFAFECILVIPVNIKEFCSRTEENFTIINYFTEEISAS